LNPTSNTLISSATASSPPNALETTAALFWLKDEENSSREITDSSSVA
jgi:hypothetical protein